MMLRLFFLLITTIMLALGLYAIARNWREDRPKVEEGMVVITLAAIGFLTTWLL